LTRVLAATLHVDVQRIKDKRDLLKGICPEAVDLLKDRNISAKALAEFRKVKPMRQIEMAELMVAGNNYTSTYAKSMVIGTHAEERLGPPKPSETEGISAEDMTKMEREMKSVSRDFRMMEDVYGKNVLNLVIAAGHLKKLLANAAIVRYLSQRHADILREFEKIAETASLEQ
jgi:hypothetical protein